MNGKAISFVVSPQCQAYREGHSAQPNKVSYYPASSPQSSLQTWLDKPCIASNTDETQPQVAPYMTNLYIDTKRILLLLNTYAWIKKPVTFIYGYDWLREWIGFLKLWLHCSYDRWFVYAMQAILMRQCSIWWNDVGFCFPNCHHICNKYQRSSGYGKSQRLIDLLIWSWSCDISADVRSSRCNHSSIN